jgi:multiple sugar transport system ATP-binding protein
MNLVGVDISRENGRFVAAFDDNRLGVEGAPGLERFVGKRVILGVRPEDLGEAPPAGDAHRDRRLSATVDIREDLGSEVYLHFGVGGPLVRGEDVKAAVGEEAIEATEAQAKGKGNLWVAKLDSSCAAKEGERVELVVETSRLRFFDPATGEGIYGDSGDSGSAEPSTS